MAGSAHFSSMDFKSGFWQIKMAPGSQQYTAFIVGNLGFYEFMRMPFRLCNALVTFQHLMQNTLGELNLTYCVIYLDDMIVFGHMEKEHLERLRVVFERFREFNLKLKPSKCSFFQLEIMYLAHHISWRGILPSWENVRAVQEFPMPETSTQVRAFCGLAGYYRRFIKGFTNIACPLYNVLGKEVKMGRWICPRSPGGHGRFEGKGPVRACPSVPRLRKAFPVGNRCLQGGTGNIALSETKQRMVPSSCFWEPLPDPGGEELP